MRKNSVIAISGYQVDHVENGILDINENRIDKGDLAEVIKDTSKKRKEKYVSDKTQHGQMDGKMYHEAYNDYVKLRLQELDEKYGINEMLKSKDMETVRKELKSSGKMRDLRKDIFQLNQELRKANQVGIDLYLTNNRNKKNIDYTNGGNLSRKDATKKYLYDNFKYNATDEQLKSIGCN